MGNWQDLVALLIVAVVAAWLLRRIWRVCWRVDSRGGCGVGCHGCPIDAGDGSVPRPSGTAQPSQCHASPRGEMVQLTLPSPDEARNR